MRQAPPGEALGYCVECGAVILGRCPVCRRRIRGELHVPKDDFMRIPDAVASLEYEPPVFCDHCGEPLPWASWADRIYQLENLLDDQDLDTADALLVLEDLERLRTAVDLDEARQMESWRRIKKRAPGLLADSGLAILRTVATTAILKSLGL